uniref:E3 ubiquitin-protein ligase brl2 isoform X1 n=1 Tax=Populus alba TaxID=43335 RepID=A0A4U5QBR7_POPAL|nr:E3 ubiquitin-protein ligase brl2 isoform X1 [Populus alba]
MESVVATVSGYHGSERFNLIKLISQSGASYVGAMSNSTTHLVCWKFEGRKYELASKFDTLVVNHRWVEECVKQGKRVPEYPYMLESGQEVGPLVLDVPKVDKLGSLNKKRKPLSDKSNNCEDSERRIVDVDCEDSGLAAWSDSFLLNDVKSLVPDVGKNNSNLFKSKLKKAKKPSKQENCSSSRCCFQDPTFSGLVGLEHGGSSYNSSRHEESDIVPNMHFVRGRRNTFSNTGSALAEPSRKGRRLMKKNVARDNLETVLSDSDQEWHPVRLYKNNKSKSTAKRTGCKRKLDIFEAEVTSDVAVINNRVSAVESLDDIEEGTHWNHLPVSEYSNSCPEGALTASEIADSSGSAAENLNAKVKDMDQFESVARLPAPAELSCVICWTEFSSTRAVLPCGHRFCYSCIQEWADHMASRRRISTCPLCKAGFSIITKVEDAATSDQKIYSQTIPHASSTVDVFFSMLQEQNKFGAECVVNAVVGNQRIYSLDVICARLDVSIPTAWTLLCHHGYALTARIFKCFIITTVNMLLFSIVFTLTRTFLEGTSTLIPILDM